MGDAQYKERAYRFFVFAILVLLKDRLKTKRAGASTPALPLSLAIVDQMWIGLPVTAIAASLIASECVG